MSDRIKVKMADYFLDNVIVARRNSIRDLGVIIDSCFEFGIHTNNVCERASHMLGFIITLPTMDSAPEQQPSVQETCSPVTGVCIGLLPHQLGRMDRIQSIQRRIVRFFGRRVGLNFDVPTAEFEERNNLQSLVSRIRLADVAFIYFNPKVICPYLLELVNIRTPSGTTSIRAGTFILQLPPALYRDFFDSAPVLISLTTVSAP